MSSFRAGTCNVVTGSATVTGNNTAWSTEVGVADLFAVEGDGITYEVASVQSDTELTLTTVYQGNNQNSANYIIVRDFTPNREYPVIYRGDIETAAVVRRAITKIDQDVETDFGIRADLASTDPGKGASLVAFEDGDTVQAVQADKGIRSDLASTAAGKGGELVGRQQADSMFALVSLAPPSADGYGIELRAFYSDTDTGGGRFYWDASRDKTTANGGTIIDPDNVGTLSTTAIGTFLDQQGTGSGTGCWVRSGSTVVPEYFGARGDGVSNDAPPFKKALSLSGHTECRNESNYRLDIIDDDDVLILSSNSTLNFNGCTVTWGMSSGYRPAFAIIGADNVHIYGGVRAVNTGVFDGVETISNNAITRLGVTLLPRAFNTFILLYGTERSSVSQVTGLGESTTKQITSYCYVAASSKIKIHDFSGDDCATVILTGGGSYYEIGRIRVGRQDASNTGILGHAVYCFADYSHIYSVTDTGEESSTVYESATVVIKSGTGTVVDGVISSRAGGPIGTDDDIDCKISNVNWIDSGKASNRIPFVIGANSSRLTVRNVRLKSERDIELLLANGSQYDIEVSMERTADSAVSSAFSRLDGNGARAVLTCWNYGTESIPQFEVHSTTLDDANIDIILKGDVTQPLIRNDLAGAVKHRITWHRPPSGGGEQQVPVLPMNVGDIQSSDAFVNSTSIYGMPPLWNNWHDTVSGLPSSVDYDLQMTRHGAFIVNVAVFVEGDYRNGVAGTWIVVFDHANGVSFANAQLLGSTISKGGNNPFGVPSVSITGDGVLNVSATLTTNTNYEVEIGSHMLNSWRR